MSDTDTLSLRARTALAALRVKSPADLAPVSLDDLRGLPNCGPRTIREIVAWGRPHTAALARVLGAEEWVRETRQEIPHVPPVTPFRRPASSKYAARVVRVYPPSEHARARWQSAAGSRGLSGWLADLAERECHSAAAPAPRPSSSRTA